jgi:hypothetical protein
MLGKFLFSDIRVPQMSKIIIFFIHSMLPLPPLQVSPGNETLHVRRRAYEWERQKNQQR